MTSARLAALPEAESLNQSTSCGPIRPLRHHKTGSRTAGRYHPYRTRYTEGDDMDAETARKLLHLMDAHAMRRVQPGLTIASVVAEMEGRSNPPTDAQVTKITPVPTSASVCPRLLPCGERVGYPKIVSSHELVVLRELYFLFAWACVVQEAVVRLHRCM
ncbi:uncharacterized protein SCHCODRAFT_02674777 [Schizophyllum commune H4-8]|nr:uncharacterized protein SCHCODRAFT_02674777 [Schizophyllum commune H4-8]KAI5900312.1 hypothetical protein SCHCODRAFT_02674777 [Schizophyllum commune H4-8]